MSGDVVKRMNVTESSLSISTTDIAEGLYSVVVYTSTATYREKLVIIK